MPQRWVSDKSRPPLVLLILLHLPLTSHAIVESRSVWSCTVNASQTIATVVQLVPVSAVTTWAALIRLESKPSSTFWCATHKPSDSPRLSRRSQQHLNLMTWQCQTLCLPIAALTCLELLHAYMVAQKMPYMQMRSVTLRDAIVESHTAWRSTVSAIRQVSPALTSATVITVKIQKNILLLTTRWLKHSKLLPRKKTS